MAGKARSLEGQSAFLKLVALTHGTQLHRYLQRRVRPGEDASDIAQEVYLRLLRLNRWDLIRQPAAYIHFLANQVLAERRMRDARVPTVYDDVLANAHLEQASHTARDAL